MRWLMWTAALAACDPPAPDPACVALLDCVAEADPLGVGQATSWFGPEGGCWGDPATAARCATACIEARVDLAARDPEAAACHPDPLAPLEDRVGRAPWDWTLRAAEPCEGGDPLRGAYSGSVTGQGAAVEVRLDALGGLTWSCAVTGEHFTCGGATTAAGAALTLEGIFHPSYVELEGTLSDLRCTWILSGWRRVASAAW